ncbi:MULTISPECIES: translocation/assembly module TamB domain-containing protein [unclassified Variovorax]|uniref:translocation/assembly module TamB domain-containing protein n=1 Tax=unclassified Variovorax TaxID=663243 RepID=UPI00076D18AA|nr:MULTISPECIES: translocation/assembly module TamB domain-containing protein [unclassified Variovorax]KWT94702.1 putative exported protein [Variovorax sp. WDL1]PNG53156.1 Translocation and assembly module TamB [Variovorax sp. B2]PNG53728.1 Translocation and assembly module TamB [Variovorax sp. B4]VTV11178.1 Autotransporter assembly factor TamB [Variovorax sp. WDL1]
MELDTQTSSPPLARSRGRRVVRAVAWSLLALILLAGVLTAGAWWWLGSNQSLAFALARAARYLPAGQTLESREVSGSLRTGGRIGWLRWQSESLAVEVHEATIGWQLAPLLKRKVQLGELHAAQVLIEHRGPVEDKPPEPLAPIVLPVDVELPFRIDTLRWAGPPALRANQLAGSYRYAGNEHRLVVQGVDIAEGHYGARVTLQGPAPMALDAALEGRVRAPLAEGRDIEVLAEATAKGTLATADARLAVAAQIKPADSGTATPMEAQLQANIAPWQPQPVIDARAQLQNLDVALLWPEAPSTLLSGEIEAGPDSSAPTGSTVWQARADIRNAKPGPWDRGRLPVEQVQVRASFDGSTWTLPEATVRAGSGRIEAQGQWSPSPLPWQARARVHGVRPGALHSELAGAPVSGNVSAEQRGEALLFDLALQTNGGAGSKALQGLRLDRALARGQWQSEVLDLRTLRIDAANASLEGKLQVRVAEQAGNGDLKLVVPGGSAQLQGRIGPASGGGEFRARVDEAATLQRWVESLPELSAVFAGSSAQGSAQLDASWKGGWQAVQRRLQNGSTPAPRGSAEPTLEATLSAPRLALRLPPPGNDPAPAREIQLRDLRAELAGSLAQATLALKGEAGSGTRKLILDARASGGLERANQWRASIATLTLQAQDSQRPGPWTLELERALDIALKSDDAGHLEVEASAASATLRGPAPGTVRIDWEPLRYSHTGAAPDRAFRLRSQGRLRGLPMAWAEAAGGSATLAEMGISGDLLFDGDWDIDAGDTLRARARLARASGDIRVQAGEAALVTRIESRGTGAASERKMNAAAEGPSTPAGLRQAELGLDAEGNTVRANLTWDSERAGQIRAEASTLVLQRAGGWQWAPDAPLAGRVTARLPNLGVWSMLAPPGWRVAGTLEADAALSGNRALPRWNGTLSADQLALRALVEGLDLRDGRLRASLSGERIEITEFTLKGGAGSSTRIPGQSGNLSTAASEAASGGGTLSARGELSWGAAPASGTGIRMAMQAQLRALRVLVRTDRQVTLSGDLQARLDNGQFNVRGNLKTDRAVIILPDESAPGLGSDVVVRSAARDREAAEAAQRRTVSEDAQAAKAQTAKPPDIAVGLDLGEDFAVQGRGLTTRLEGKLEIRSTALNAPPRITGEVRTVKGQYRAYGQRLDVETGIARFNGPYDNPALDILAIRPNISQRAGVQITGSAQSPRVRLYSEPVLSDAETLSWVVLGRASATSGGESLLLQQAALALLGRLGSGSHGGGLASRFGLDEIGFKGPGNGGDVRDSAVTVGKRLSKDFYLTYERSLSGTLGSLFIFYDLTRRLTLRGQAGQQSGIDLIYTVKYD